MQGEPSTQARLARFLAKKDIAFTVERYLIGALGAMALGLFGTLIIGVILETLGDALGLAFLVTAGEAAKAMMGAGIGVAVAYGLKAPPLVLFSATVVGAAGAAAGGPVGAWIASVIAVELGKMVAGETKMDIVVTPAMVVVAGVLAAQTVGPPIAAFMEGLGALIMWATELRPLPMGVLVAVVMGWALTSPVSSAALAIALQLEGPAGGAALAGCAAHMVGFAVASLPDNGWGGLVSQGLGTSMLQVPNIIRRPAIGIPATVASIIAGPMATLVFRMDTLYWGAGMGTSGLVGQFATVAAMGSDVSVFASMGLLHFVIPAVLAGLTAIYLRKRGWIRPADMALTPAGVMGRESASDEKSRKNSREGRR